MGTEPMGAQQNSTERAQPAQEVIARVCITLGKAGNLGLLQPGCVWGWGREKTGSCQVSCLLRALGPNPPSLPAILGGGD